MAGYPKQALHCHNCGYKYWDPSDTVGWPEPDLYPQRGDTHHDDWDLCPDCGAQLPSRNELRMKNSMAFQQKKRRHESRTWSMLERLLREGRQYRGQTDIRLQDLEKLVDAIGKKGGQVPPLDPKGGFFNCRYPFKPRVWTGWRPELGAALAIASTDSKRDVPSVGAPQGGTVMKRNYGGRVVYVPGPGRPNANDRLGSAMDRYDVIMVGDVADDEGILTRLAYSPAIGDNDERRSRLEDLLAGRTPAPASRRVQPDVPQKPDTVQPPAQAVPRQGHDASLAGRATPPERGTPARAEWDSARSTAKKDLGIPPDTDFTDWLRMKGRKSKD